MEMVRRHGSHLQSVKVIDCYAEDIPAHIAKNSADYVVCTYVLCSVEDVTKVLKNVHHILKPVAIINVTLTFTYA